MTSTFKQTELFGGAIVVDLPEGYIDVSTIRQVPDNQEVYLSATGLTSITIDITERVSHLPTDIDALKYHLDDLVSIEESSHGGSDEEKQQEQVRIWTIEDVKFEKLSPPLPALTLLCTITPPSPQPQPQPQPPSTALLLTLLRLPPQKTDILITINIPHPSSTATTTASDHPSSTTLALEEEEEEEEGKTGKGKATSPLMEEGMRIREAVVGTLEVRDWGLFC
ncbi:multicopy suppressor of ts gsp1 [Loxospora ochrophaea]|nr:multicopy suppressor of ts gsp1 [Loxospora ochrophaea]